MHSVDQRHNSLPDYHVFFLHCFVCAWGIHKVRHSCRVVVPKARNWATGCGLQLLTFRVHAGNHEISWINMNHMESCDVNLLSLLLEGVPIFFLPKQFRGHHKGSHELGCGGFRKYSKDGFGRLSWSWGVGGSGGIWKQEPFEVSKGSRKF